MTLPLLPDVHTEWFEPTIAPTCNCAYDVQLRNGSSAVDTYDTATNHWSINFHGRVMRVPPKMFGSFARGWRASRVITLA